MNEKHSIIDMANNKRRVFDQCASMHFKLSDEYKHLANIEDALEIVISVILCGVTFLDCETYFHISSAYSTLIIGFVSIFLLAFTLIKQNLGHKQLCEKHLLAGKMYAKSKLDLTTKIAEWSANPQSDIEMLSYLDDHYSTLNDLPQIPDKYFTRLKHAHQEKVEFSKFLDNHRNEFWLICKLKFRFCKKKSIDKTAEKQ